MEPVDATSSSRPITPPSSAPRMTRGRTIPRSTWIDVALSASGENDGSVGIIDSNSAAYFRSSASAAVVSAMVYGLYATLSS
jgi:hypothetical protein